MPVIRFNGCILPKHYKVTLTPIPSISWKMPDLNFNVVCHTQIRESVVTVDCDCNKFDQSIHLVPLFNRVIDIARAPVDLFAFSKGMGLSIVFETVTEKESGELAQ